MRLSDSHCNFEIGTYCVAPLMPKLEWVQTGDGDKMFCVKCGYPMKTNYKFCPKCGAKQLDLAAQHFPNDSKDNQIQEAGGLGQAEVAFSNDSSDAEVAVMAVSDPSVSVRYQLNGITKTVKLTLPCVLGRNYECPFLLTDEKTSQQHAKVYLENNSVMIEDLCSLNGTYVNGEKIKGPVELLSGDEVMVGMTNLFFIVSVES